MMADEMRLAEIRARVEALETIPFRTEWDGQQFTVYDRNGDAVLEYTFAIPTWGERYETAKSTCDVAVPTFLAHAPDDVKWLLERLAAAEQQQPGGER